MAGLLDDPRQAGLLALGLGLLNSKGNFGQGLGQAGMMSYGAMIDAQQRQRQAQQDEQRQKMLEQQMLMQQLQAQMAQQRQAQAQEAAQGKAGYLRSLSGQAGPPEPMNVPKAMQYLDPREIQMLQGGEPEYKVVGGSLVKIGPQGVSEAFRAPDESKQSSLAQLFAELNALPPGDPRRGIYQDAIRKATTHQPASVVNTYGSPVPFELPGGGVGYVQPGNRSGAPPQVMTMPGTNEPMRRPTEPKEMSPSQSVANTYASRMIDADKTLSELADKGAKRPSIAQRVTGGEGLTGAIATAVATPEQQQIDQAERNFINAVLRRESGAVINPAEFENARKQYFVQPGDSDAVIRQKARNRRIAIEGMIAEVPENRRGVPTLQTPSTPASGPSGRFLGFE